MKMGGNHEASPKTDCTSRACGSAVHFGSCRGDAPCAERCGAEPFWPAENRAARGGVQVPGGRVELRPGESHRRYQGYGGGKTPPQKKFGEKPRQTSPPVSWGFWDLGFVRPRPPR